MSFSPLSIRQNSDGYLVFFTGTSNGDSGVAGDNDLFWDRNNNRLGIGTSLPEQKLHIVGDVLITGEIKNSILSEALETIINEMDGYASKQTESEHYTQLSSAITTITKDLDGYLDETKHAEVDDLVHNISEDSYEELIYNRNLLSSNTIWTDAGKTKKIREELFTYSNNNISAVITNQYDPDGNLKQTFTENYSWIDGKITNIIRTLT